MSLFCQRHLARNCQNNHMCFLKNIFRFRMFKFQDKLDTMLKVIFVSFNIKSQSPVIPSASSPGSQIYLKLGEIRDFHIQTDNPSLGLGTKHTSLVYDCIDWSHKCPTNLVQQSPQDPWIGEINALAHPTCRELSGRVLDSRPRGHGFEPHRCTALWSLRN